MPEILLVEDTEMTKMLKTDALQDAGFSVTPACNGLEALQILDSGRSDPAAIVSDLNQPVFEGYDLTHVLRGPSKWRQFEQIPDLAERFREKVEIALRYEHLRDKFGGTPLILTSSGARPNWKCKKHPNPLATFPEWERLNAEALHCNRALDFADIFFVVRPIPEIGPFTSLVGMEELVDYLKSLG